MSQFLLDAMRGALAFVLIIGVAGLIAWLIIPGMSAVDYHDHAARFASRIRMFNAMFGGLAILAMLVFGLMAYGNSR